MTARKPRVAVAPQFLDVAKAAAIGRFEFVLASPHPAHFRFHDMPEALGISIVRMEDRLENPLDQCRRVADHHLAVPAYLQRYVIFDSEYSWVRRELDPYHYWEGTKTKVIFTPNTQVAVSYALGILEKAAKHGIYS